MDMFTSYGLIKKPKQNKIIDSFMILAWDSPFNSQSIMVSQIKILCC